MYSAKKTLRRIAAVTAVLTAVMAISSGSGVQAKIEAKNLLTIRDENHKKFK